MHGLRHFLLALQFFTRIPVTGRLAQWVGYSPAMLQASAAHFPGVGWVVGAIGAVVLLAAAHLLPGGNGALAAAVLCTVATVWLTGAFHEDGLADTADGLGGSSKRERALEIMKDSRIGSFGAIALMLALLLKAALLAALAGQGALDAAAAVLAAHVLSRLAPLAVMRALPYVGGEGGKAKPMAEAVSGGALVAGCVWSLPAGALLLVTQGGAHFAAALLLGALATGWMVRLLRRRLQGFTGDALGATQQLVELCIYLALALRP